MAQKVRMGKAEKAADQYIRGIISQFRGTTPERLPLMTEMARRAGVSHPVLMRVVRRYVAQGIFSVRNRSGVWIIAGKRVELDDIGHPVVKTRETIAHRTALRLTVDVREGKIGTDSSMPSFKELQMRYGVCYRTLKKALDSTVENGFLQVCRRKYRTIAVRGASVTDTIVLICCGDLQGNPEIRSHRTINNLHQLERECSHLGVQLVIHPLSPSRSFDIATLEKHLAARKSSVILGFLVWLCGWDGNSSGILFQTLSAFNKPVALLDQTEDIPYSLFNTLSVPFYPFTMATSATAGREMAHFLLNQGHEKIAYISPVHRAQWSINRLTGMREVYGAAGLTGAVTVLSIDKTGQWEYVDDPYNLHNQINALMPEGMRPAYQHRMDTILGFAQLEKSLRPHLDELLADPTITAWVTCSDIYGLYCLDYLKRKGIAVPRQMSVASFDDIAESSPMKLTSYNFNEPVVMSAMVQSIMQYAGPKKKRQDTPVEITGVIVKRESVMRRDPHC